MSRAHTVEEMREMFIRHLAGIADYWAKTDLSRPEFQDSIQKAGGETQWRMHGMLHSFLVLFDGGSGMMPAFNITPDPHPSDEDFHREEGSNWWVSEVINDCQLHDLYNQLTRK